MHYYEDVFCRDVSAKVQICLEPSDRSIYPNYLVDALHFALDCLPAMASLKRPGPIVLSGLPVDFTSSLALAAWFCGRPVAFFNVDATAKQQQSMLDKLNPGLWITMSKPECDIPAETFLIDLQNEMTGHTFEDWLVRPVQDAIPTQSFAWSENDVAVILFTSGSTGEPKGVCHSLQSMLYSGQQFLDQFKVTFNDHILNFAHLHTMSGLRCSLFLPLMSGCSTQLEPVSGQLSDVLDQIDKQASTILIAGPNLLKTMTPILARVPALKQLRLILSTGAKLPRKVRVAFWKALNVTVLDYYGLTETSGIVIAELSTNYDPENLAIGKACAGIVAAVVDQQNQETTAGKGILRIYSPAIFLGYWGDKLKQSAYFDTQDSVEIDQQGNIFLLGRAGRSIKSTLTTWLHPEAVEKWLANHSMVEDFAVSTTESNIICFVALSKHLTSTVLSDWKTALSNELIAELGKDYGATQWCKVDKIPRSNLSKINWKELPGT